MVPIRAYCRFDVVLKGNWARVLERPVDLRLADIGAADISGRARAWRSLVGKDAAMDIAKGVQDYRTRIVIVEYEQDGATFAIDYDSRSERLHWPHVLGDPDSLRKIALALPGGLEIVRLVDGWTPDGEGGALLDLEHVDAAGSGFAV